MRLVRHAETQRLATEDEQLKLAVEGVFSRYEGQVRDVKRNGETIPRQASLWGAALRSWMVTVLARRSR